MKWEPNLPTKEYDDFTATANGYMLRVEQLDEHLWWYSVIPEDKDKICVGYTKTRAGAKRGAIAKMKQKMKEEQK